MRYTRLMAEIEQLFDDDAWIVAASSELAIRARALGAFLARGGSITGIRLLEGRDGAWTMRIRLSDRPGEFRVNQFKSDEPRSYRDVALAVGCCRSEFKYGGPITLLTDIPAGP